MGRLESLTAWGLGRGHYEDEVIQTEGEGSGAQQYNDRGYPRNPETKRREREHVRAANEVMQVTGVVEDFLAAKAKNSQYMLNKTRETLSGLRFMELGRAAFVGGVWGVLGMRRRILLYKDYSDLRFLDIISLETSNYSVGHFFTAGLPSIVAYQAVDWVEFFLETILDNVMDEEEHELTVREKRIKKLICHLLDLGVTWITLHFRMFAILQQVNLIPASMILPHPRSFIPFSMYSPFQLPPAPTFGFHSICAWGVSLLYTFSPVAYMYAQGRIKNAVSKRLYRPIYKLLPRPTGDSMFAGLAIQSPVTEYDTPDRPERSHRVEDQPTLRALEGYPASEQPPQDREGETDEEEEVTHATLISFDVEATEAVESSLGTWSAELRSANEPKPSDENSYRVTGLTMLPTIMATEALREAAAGVVVLPIEAFMVRCIGNAFLRSAGRSATHVWPTSNWIYGSANLIAAFAAQLTITGAVWVGFTITTQLWARRKRAQLAESSHEAWELVGPGGYSPAS